MPLMRVDMYSINHGYGFCVPLAGEGRVFFRVEDFDGEGILPIMGETVEVPALVEGERSPRAVRVVRTQPPLECVGLVTSFDSVRGWGFIQSEGVSYFLHRSDLQDRFIPVIGSSLRFYAGVRRGKPRACYVRLRGKI